MYFCNLISCLAIDGLIRFFALGKLLFCQSKLCLHFGHVRFQFDRRVTVLLITSFTSVFCSRKTSHFTAAHPIYRHIYAFILDVSIQFT